MQNCRKSSNEACILLEFPAAKYHSWWRGSRSTHARSLPLRFTWRTRTDDDHRVMHIQRRTFQEKKNLPLALKGIWPANIDGRITLRIAVLVRIIIIVSSAKSRKVVATNHRRQHQRALAQEHRRNVWWRKACHCRKYVAEILDPFPKSCSAQKAFSWSKIFIHRKSRDLFKIDY